MRKSLVFVLTLLSAAFAYGEIPVSEPLIGRGAGWQSAPVSASDGRDFLLVWTDMRRGQSAVYATRVAADGEVLDPEGILVSTPDRNAYAPHVAWTGSSYAIVWAGPEGPEFRKLAPDGTFIGSPRRVLDRSIAQPRVAVSNGAMLIAGVKWYHDAQIAVIDDAGLARNVHEIRGWSSIDLACTPSNCLAVHAAYGGTIVGRSIGRDGALLDSTDRVLASNAKGAAIASSGDRYLLVWPDLSKMQANDVAGPPLPPSRKLWARELDGEPFLVAETKKAEIFAPLVAPSGREFIVLWTQEHERERVIANAARRSRVEMHARVIGDDENVVMPVPEITRYQRPAIASNGSTHLAAWIEGDGFGKIAAGVSGHLQSLSPIAVTRTATEQTDEQMIDCGDHLLVTWSEDIEGDGTFAIFARRFHYSGEAVDVAPIRIAQSSVTQRNPAAAFDGTSYLIAWSQNDAVYARTLNPDGTVAGEVMMLSEGEGDAPSVTATGRGFAVLHRMRGTDGVPHLSLARIDDGLLLRTDLGRWFHIGHGVAWNGAEIVAIWTSSESRILGARFTVDGAPLDADALVVGRGMHLTSDLSIVCAVGECAITWSELAAGTPSVRLVGGSVFPINEPIRDFTDYRQLPAERFDAFVLRAGNAFQFFASDESGVLYARTVRNGIPSAETHIYQQPTRVESHGSIVNTPDGLMRVYARPVDAPGYAGARRLFLAPLSN